MWIGRLSARMLDIQMSQQLVTLAGDNKGCVEEPFYVKIIEILFGSILHGVSEL